MEKPAKKPKLAEKDVQRQIMEYLKMRGYFFFRNNTGGFTNSKGHYYRFGYVGSGDIFGFTKSGRFFSIEVKATGKKPTPEQHEFMAKVNDTGNLAFYADNLETVMFYLK